MKIVLQSGNSYILRFDPGDEVMQGLIEFAMEEDIEAASFTGIGAAKKSVISYYDSKTKGYIDKELDEETEIVNLIGNIGRMKGADLKHLEHDVHVVGTVGDATSKADDIVIHAHVGLSRKNFEMVGGHVIKLVISVTCEIAVTKLEGKLRRALNKDIGLNLLS